MEVSLCNRKELDFEYQRRVAGNVARRAFAVTHFRRNVNYPMVSDVHIQQCELKAFYEFVYAKGFGVIPAIGIVKYPAVY